MKAIKETIFHIVYEDGYWSLWGDGRIIERFHSKEEALIKLGELMQKGK